ncbi:MAG: nuclear transport factor 2 family protein [Acidimicrobiales bacterium]
MGDYTPIGVTDYVDISRLINRYADAVVHRNGVQWSSCWAHDATWELGPGRNVEGIEAITKLWYGAMAGFAAVFHVVHNGEVWQGADADHASARWYISESYQRADGTRGILLAHYDDTYVRRDGRWWIASRRLTPHYAGAQDLSATFQSTKDALVARGVASDV